MSLFTDVETRVQAWLKTSPVAEMVTAGTRVDIYLAMPKGAPNPCILLSLVSGGPGRRTDLPESHSRISFDVFGKTRAEASGIAYALMEQLENLGRYGGNDNGLCSASIQLIRWQPGPQSDTPRYIVDALITTVS